MEGQRKRVEYVDALKGFAIICVVLGHVIESYMTSAVWPELNAGLHGVFNVIYSFHMPLFFAISGYVYSLVYFDSEGVVKKQKIKSHLIDLVWIYLVFNILMWAFKYVGGDGVNKPVGISNLLMIWAVPMATFWYLYVLVVLYIIFVPVLQKRVNPLIPFILLIILCLASNFVKGGWFQIHNILYFAIFFWIGSFKQRNGSFVLMRKWGATISFLVALALMIIFWDSETNFNGIPVANAVIAVGIVGMCWFVFENLVKRGGNLLSLCGRYSLEIYVIHCFIAPGLRILGMGTKVMGNMPIVCLSLNFLLSLSLPILFAYLLKKLNLHQPFFKPYEFVAGRKNESKQ